MIRAAVTLIAVLCAAAAPAALAASGDMNKPMSMPMPDKPVKFDATRQAYTGDHRFLVKLLSVPKPIPYEKYFDLRFAVYDGRDPSKPLSDAQLQVNAGMRHGLKQGMAHGMQSAPKVAEKDGAFDVSGMYFHMMGPWTVEAVVREGGKQGTATFQLPCCGQ